MIVQKNIKFLTIGASLLLASCQFNGETENKQVDRQLADTLTYQYKNYIRYSDNIIKTSEVTDTTYFIASYPEFTDSVINRFVLSTLLGKDSASVDSVARVFIDEFDRFHESDPFPRIWTSESHAKVFAISPTYMALAIDASTYTGGAHGNYATVFTHYDLATNNGLTLADIVVPKYQNELTAVAERFFRLQENLDVDESLEDAYFFDGGQFSIPENFALERDHILFLYNIYEIKPYVDGQTELRVPYPDIEHLLTERAKGIIAELRHHRPQTTDH